MVRAPHGLCPHQVHKHKGYLCCGSSGEQQPQCGDSDSGGGDRPWGGVSWQCLSLISCWLHVGSHFVEIPQYLVNYFIQW